VLPGERGLTALIIELDKLEPLRVAAYRLGGPAAYSLDLDDQP
jgi:hypothetical protein